MHKATVAEKVVSDTIRDAVLDYPVVRSYSQWHHYKVDRLTLVLFRYMGAVNVLGRPKSSN